MLLMLAQPASATVMSEISDSSGDANRWINNNKVIPEYLDIATATLTEDDDMFTLEMEMYGMIPAEPVLFNGVQTLLWEWAFDKEGGPYPVAHHWGTWEEYVVCVIWNGVSWSAQLWDFTVVQNPGDPVSVQELAMSSIPDDGFTVTVQSSLMPGIIGGYWAVADMGFMSPPLKCDGNAWWYFDWAGIDPVTYEWTPLG